MKTHAHKKLTHRKVEPTRPARARGGRGEAELAGGHASSSQVNMSTTDRLLLLAVLVIGLALLVLLLQI
jgi:hypothetical protein